MVDILFALLPIKLIQTFAHINMRYISYCSVKTWIRVGLSIVQTNLDLFKILGGMKIIFEENENNI